jgi:hypothetical protein
MGHSFSDREEEAAKMAKNQPACVRHPEIAMLGASSSFRLNFGYGTIENVQWEFTCAECKGVYSASIGYQFGDELVCKQCPIHPTFYMFAGGGKLHCPIEGCASA